MGGGLVGVDCVPKAVARGCDTSVDAIRPCDGSNQQWRSGLLNGNPRQLYKLFAPLPGQADIPHRGGTSTSRRLTATSATSPIRQFSARKYGCRLFCPPQAYWVRNRANGFGRK